MMRLPKIDRAGSEGVRSGFNSMDQRLLDKENDHTPVIQTFTTSKLSTEEQPLCADCGTKLLFLERTQHYLCTYCIKDISAISNTPLTSVDQSMQPYQSQHFDPNNPEGEPYFVSFNPDSHDMTVNKNYEVIYDTGRVKHVKVNGYPLRIDKDAFND